MNLDVGSQKKPSGCLPSLFVSPYKTRNQTSTGFTAKAVSPSPDRRIVQESPARKRSLEISSDTMSSRSKGKKSAPKSLVAPILTPPDEGIRKRPPPQQVTQLPPEPGKAPKRHTAKSVKDANRKKLREENPEWYNKETITLTNFSKEESDKVQLALFSVAKLRSTGFALNRKGKLMARKKVGDLVSKQSVRGGKKSYVEVRAVDEDHPGHVHYRTRPQEAVRRNTILMLEYVISRPESNCSQIEKHHDCRGCKCFVQIKKALNEVTVGLTIDGVKDLPEPVLAVFDIITRLVDGLHVLAHKEDYDPQEYEVCWDVEDVLHYLTSNFCPMQFGTTANNMDINLVPILPINLAQPGYLPMVDGAGNVFSEAQMKLMRGCFALCFGFLFELSSDSQKWCFSKEVNSSLGELCKAGFYPKDDAVTAKALIKARNDSGLTLHSFFKHYSNDHNKIHQMIFHCIGDLMVQRGHSREGESPVREDVQKYFANKLWGVRDVDKGTFKRVHTQVDSCFGDNHCNRHIIADWRLSYWFLQESGEDDYTDEHTPLPYELQLITLPHPDVTHKRWLERKQEQKGGAVEEAVNNELAEKARDGNLEGIHRGDLVDCKQKAKDDFKAVQKPKTQRKKRKKKGEMAAAPDVAEATQDPPIPDPVNPIEVNAPEENKSVEEVAQWNGNIINQYQQKNQQDKKGCALRYRNVIFPLLDKEGYRDKTTHWNHVADFGVIKTPEYLAGLALEMHQKVITMDRTVERQNGKCFEDGLKGVLQHLDITCDDGKEVTFQEDIVNGCNKLLRRRGKKWPVKDFTATLLVNYHAYDSTEIQAMHTDNGPTWIKEIQRDGNGAAFTVIVPLSPEGCWIRVWPCINNNGDRNNDGTFEWEKGKEQWVGHLVHVRYGSSAILPQTLLHAGYIDTAYDGSPRLHFGVILSENDEHKTKHNSNGFWVGIEKGTPSSSTTTVTTILVEPPPPLFATSKKEEITMIQRSDIVCNLSTSLMCGVATPDGPVDLNKTVTKKVTKKKPTTTKRKKVTKKKPTTTKRATKSGATEEESQFAPATQYRRRMMMGNKQTMKPQESGESSSDEANSLLIAATKKGKKGTEDVHSGKI